MVYQKLTVCNCKGTNKGGSRLSGHVAHATPDRRLRRTRIFSSHIYMHSFCKKWMLISIIGIILPCIILSKNAVSSKIKKQFCILTNKATDHLINMIAGNNLPYYKERSDIQTTATKKYSTIYFICYKFVIVLLYSLAQISNYIPYYNNS